MSKCRSCGASIVWVRTEAKAGKPDRAMPLDADQRGKALVVGNGNLVFTGLRSGDGTPIVRAVASNQGMHVSHFYTCPAADEHRRR